ncbi:MAG: glutamyl-tRNA reductase, partial [Dehalococcoidia bacterium]
SLAESGASRILVTNRTYERAQELAQRLGGHPLPFQRLPQALEESDIVISATGADNFVLGPDLVAQAMAGRNGRGLLIIDIAVPRDVDPAVRDIPGVRLFDIDDLEAVSQTNLEGRQREVMRVEAIVEEEVARFLAWWRSLDVVPAIAYLRQRAETIRSRELDRAFRRLPDLSPEEQARIEAMTIALVKKMLHDPIARLKGDGDARRYLEAVQALFGAPSGQEP